MSVVVTQEAARLAIKVAVSMHAYRCPIRARHQQQQQPQRPHHLHQLPLQQTAQAAAAAVLMVKDIFAFVQKAIRSMQTIPKTVLT